MLFAMILLSAYIKLKTIKKDLQLIDKYFDEPVGSFIKNLLAVPQQNPAPTGHIRGPMSCFQTALHVFHVAYSRNFIKMVLQSGRVGCILKVGSG